MEQGRILALDPGSKRIGVALSDEMRWFAQPLETYERRSLREDMGHIQSLIDTHAVNCLLLGLPLHMNGQVGQQSEDMKRFHRELEGHLSVPIVLWDERLTSRAAEQLLIEANVSRQKRKTVVDRVAAAILLQSYLDHLSCSQPVSPFPEAT